MTQTNTKRQPQTPTTPTGPTTIVVGVRLDEAGTEVLRQAVALADRMEGTLQLCHVAGSPTEDAKVDAVVLETAEEQLQAWAAERLLGTRYFERTTLHALLGDPAKALVTLAADVNADFIVVGRSEQGRLARTLNGTVARDLIARAVCPVLVAVPVDYADVDKSLAIEPPLKEGQVATTIAKPHIYRFRRSLPMTSVPTSTAAAQGMSGASGPA